MPPKYIRGFSTSLCRCTKITKRLRKNHKAGKITLRNISKESAWSWNWLSTHFSTPVENSVEISVRIFSGFWCFPRFSTGFRLKTPRYTLSIHSFNGFFNIFFRFVPQFQRFTPSCEGYSTASKEFPNPNKQYSGKSKSTKIMLVCWKNHPRLYAASTIPHSLLLLLFYPISKAMTAQSAADVECEKHRTGLCRQKGMLSWNSHARKPTSMRCFPMLQRRQASKHRWKRSQPFISRQPDRS